MAIRVLTCMTLTLLLPFSVLADDPEPPNPKAAKAKAKVLQLKAAGGAAVKGVKKATKAQQEAAKKLLEATKAASAASKEYVAARTALAKAAEEKIAAEKRFAEATKKYQETRKVVMELSNPKRKAVQVRVARGGFAGAPTVGGVREKVDPKDPIERFALLTPVGPVVVEASITVAGKPFRVAREKLVDEYLATADANNDGEATWDEALKSARFTSRRVRITNDEQRKQAIKSLDTNADKLVDRAEVRLFVARYFQGPAFTITGSNRYSYGRGFVLSSAGRVRYGGQADVRKLLDTDNDGILSKEEVAAAGDRLKSRDADDNDLLLAGELSGNVRTTGRQNFARQRQPQPQLAVLLGPTAKTDALFQALKLRYKNKDDEIVAKSFSGVPKLFEKLDENKDGKLQQDEVKALNTVKPHINLEVSLGKSEGPKGLAIKAIAEELSATAKKGETLSVELPGIKLALAANLAEARTFNYDRTATTYITRYDKDANKYLERKELPANFVQQFDLWDGDNDGKVFAKEISASYARMLAPQMSQIRGTAAMQGNILFQALDVSGDSRLSLREMRTAHERIKSFDKNKDGRVTQAEIPVSLSMTFGLGTAGYSRAQGSRITRAGAARPASNGAPEWFNRMDRNGDGDVTLKEFLGNKQQFSKLDTNSDGFIEPKEAKAAKTELD